MQVSVKNTDVLASLLTDHSPVTFSYCKNEESNGGRGFWKFNNSLIENEEYVHQMKNFFFRYFKWTLQWKHSRWSGKMGIFEIQC